MDDNQMRKTDIAEWFERRKKTILTIGVPALVMVIFLIVIICIVVGKKKKPNILAPTPTPVATPTAMATLSPTPVAVKDTPTPTPTPTKVAEATPTPTEKPAATPTPTVTAAPTSTPLPTATPVPQEPDRITAEEAYAILCGFGKTALNIEKEVGEYQVEYDKVPNTNINGFDCYQFTLYEVVGGKRRNRGDFYIADDGKKCFVVDDYGNFVPFPQG